MRQSLIKIRGNDELHKQVRTKVNTIAAAVDVAVDFQMTIEAAVDGDVHKAVEEEAVDGRRIEDIKMPDSLLEMMEGQLKSILLTNLALRYGKTSPV